MLSKTIFSCHWRDQEQMPCAILPAIKKSSLANVCYKPKSHQTPLGTPLGQQSMIANKSRVKSLYSQRLWRAGGLNFFSGKRQGVTRSLFQFSRREREFFSFNLMFETRTRISFSQSRASRREWEFLFSILGFKTRMRIVIDMSFCLKKFEWKSHFRDENGNTFLSISCFERRTRNRKWFLKVEREKFKMILTVILGNGNSRHSLASASQAFFGGIFWDTLNITKKGILWRLFLKVSDNFATSAVEVP